MSERRVKPSAKDGLKALAVTYVCLTLAGTFTTMLPRPVPARALALVVFMMLIALYAFRTETGRRTRSTAYLFSAVLCPLLIVILAIIGWLLLASSYLLFPLLEGLVAALAVGFEIGDDPSIPAWLGFLIWWLEIPVVVLFIILARDRVAKRERSS